MAIVLVAVPADPLGVVTFTETVHEVAAAPPASVPPLSETVFELATAVTMPPTHVVDAPGVKAITCNAGNVSVNAMLLNADAFAARVTVTVNTVFWPANTVAGANALAAVSAAPMFTTPVIGNTLLPISVLTAFAAIVLVRFPVGAVGPTCTGTVIVHELLAGITPELIVMSVVAGTAVTMPPAQVVDAAGADATVKFGEAPIVVRLSVNAVMFASVAVTLFNVIVIVKMPVCTALPVKLLLPVILLAGFTTRAPLAAAYFTPLLKVPATMLFVRVIAFVVRLVAVTVVLIVHEVFVIAAFKATPAKLPPVSTIVVAVDVLVLPPHVVVIGPLIVMPAGSASVKSTGSTLALKLLTVIVSVEVPPLVMGVGENALAIDAAV
jgi:hypothetical protein